MTIPDRTVTWTRPDGSDLDDPPLDQPTTPTPPDDDNDNGNDGNEQPELTVRPEQSVLLDNTACACCQQPVGSQSRQPVTMTLVAAGSNAS